jgi:hypothetical protein
MLTSWTSKDVLLGLPLNRLGQFGRRHHGQSDLLDDDGVARERGDDLDALEPLGLEDAADRVRHGDGIDDGAIDDRVGKDRLDGKRRDAVAVLPLGFQFDRLDGTRPDVEADQRSRFPQK